MSSNKNKLAKLHAEEKLFFKDDKNPLNFWRQDDI